MSHSRSDSLASSLSDSVSESLSNSSAESLLREAIIAGDIASESLAAALDEADSLKGLQDGFVRPVGEDGSPKVYLAGNSLGLPTVATADYVANEIDRWGTLGVEGHFSSELGWASYHQLLTDQMSMIVGGHPNEVVVMNSLTVNLHLLMVSFYRPTKQRHKILIESHAFPSDHFAVESQIRQRGFDPESSLVVVEPIKDGALFDPDHIVDVIEQHGQELALVLLPGVQYYTGQVLPMVDITRAAHQVGALVGFDLAHAAGNIRLELHDWGVDFAAWCSYKYLNAGPGAVGGCFVHNRHIGDETLPKFLGWWGTKAETRFKMETVFEPIPTVESWQISNAPVLSMASLRASLDMIDKAGGMTPLRAKSEVQVRYLDALLDEVLDGRVSSITPRPMEERGCQFALEIVDLAHDGKAVFDQLAESDIVCDWRYPNVIRVAPVPLYNSFADIRRFVMTLDRILA